MPLAETTYQISEVPDVIDFRLETRRFLKFSPTWDSVKQVTLIGGAILTLGL